MQLATYCLACFSIFALCQAVPSNSPPAQPSEKAVTQQLHQKKSCCAVLDYFLPGKILKPGSSSYASSLASYWGQQEQEITPSCIVYPDTAQDVSTGVLVLSIGDRLSLKDCDFAVRSGGHTPWGGAANIKDGVTFDLQKLNSVEVSGDRKTAAIGTGNRWGNVFPKLDAQGLASVGGRVSLVGAGGFLTGGGISYFSPRKGFACDNVANFQVVNANGRLINANSTSNPDLFKALKGGSNNFGIVTRFDLEIFEQGDLWGGYQRGDLSAQDEQISFFENFTKAETYDEYASFILSYAFQGTAEPWFSEMNILYTKPEPFPVVYKPLFKLASTSNTFRTAPLTSFTDEIARNSILPPESPRYNFATFTFQNSKEAMKGWFDLLDAWKQLNSDVPGFRGATFLQPMPRNITSKSAAKGGNVMGLESAPDLVMVNLGFSWGLAADDEKVKTRTQALIDNGVKQAKYKGKDYPFRYLNYAVSWQKPIGSYGKENVEFLKKVSKEVDPRGLFQRRVPGGFKLND